MTVSAKTIVLVLFTIFFLVGAWTEFRTANVSSSISQPSSSETIKPLLAYETRTHNAGDVTVSATPKTLQKGDPAVFEVVFETHSVNLDFDVAAQARLIDNANRSYGIPLWTGSPPGGHHRQGTLSFDEPLDPEARTVSLAFNNIAGVARRVLSWEVVQK